MTTDRYGMLVVPHDPARDLAAQLRAERRRRHLWGRTRRYTEEHDPFTSFDPPPPSETLSSDIALTRDGMTFEEETGL